MTPVLSTQHDLLSGFRSRFYLISDGENWAPALLLHSLHGDVIQLQLSLIKFSCKLRSLKVVLLFEATTHGVDKWSEEPQTWDRLRIAHGLLPPALMHQGLSNQAWREGFPSAAPACSSSWHNSSPETLLWREPRCRVFTACLSWVKGGAGVHTPMRMQRRNQLVSISIPLVGKRRTGSCGQTHEEDKRCDWSSRLDPL